MTDSPMVGRRANVPMEPYRMEPPMCPIPNDWSRYGLDEIWRMLSHHSPATAEAAASMWKTIEILCQEQAERLSRALVALEARWPSDQAASQAFQGWGMSLVQAMQRTAETARLNRPVPANISEEIDRARQRVAALISDRAYYQELEQSGGSLTANAVSFGRELFDGDLEFSTWRSTLDRNAREVMADLEQKIFNYARQLYADPPFEPPLGDERRLPDLDADGSSDETAGAGWGGGRFVPAGGWPAGWDPGTSTVVDGGWSSGGDPVFGGAPEDGDTVLDGVAAGPAGPLSGGGLGGSGGVFVDTPWGRVLAPGGVIGAPAAGGVAAVPGGPGAAAGPAPAGLVPGTGSPARTPAGAGMVPFMPPMAPGRPGAAGTAGTASGRRSRRGLPSVFDSPSGPPGVIQPPPEPAEHDPGPGVIGIDR